MKKQILFLILIVIGSVGLGMKFGKYNTYAMVQKECEVFGGFFVGNKVYKCQLSEKTKNLNEGEAL